MAELPILPLGGESEAEVPLDACAARGDRDALQTLLCRHAGDVHRLCHFVAGAADAEDSAQMAFERIVARIRRFDPSRGTFRSWALTVTRNVCRDRQRRRKLERAAFHPAGGERADQAAHGAPTPEGAAQQKGDALMLESALATLPEPMGAALVLFHMHEASYQEIATILEVPIGTVMTWLHRGRKRLRRALEEGLTPAAASGHDSPVLKP